MRITLFIWALIIGIAASGQSTKFPVQEIIDSVYVSQTSRESFSLYLPSGYDLDDNSSVVLIFDPRGRGRIGISPFIQAAETYNHMLICSNDSKNGPYEQNLQITSRLIEKVFSEFNIDEKRIYTAGFSGGARLAASIAIKTQMIQGVVACGAGMSTNDLLFQKNWNFSYAAIVGDRDMNLTEMIKTKDYIDKLKVSNELFVYDMNHKWPSQEQVLEAFDWLQLEVIKKGVSKQNESSVKEVYSKYLKKAKKFETENELVPAFYEYQRLIDNFSLYLPMDSIRKVMMNLRNSPEFKRQKNERDRIFKEEDALSDMYFKRFYDDLNKKNHNLKWWEKKIDKMKKDKQNSGSETDKMLDRLLYSVFALAMENVTIEGVDNLDQAIFCYDICIEIYPEHYILYFKQIDNCLKLNNEEQAINYLQKMLSAGYEDIEAIKANSLFDRLKSNNRYQELIN